MANRPLPTIPIDVEAVKGHMKIDGYSIRRLARHPWVDRDERTLQRWFARKEMPSFMLYNIARILNVSMDYLTL